MSTSIPHFDVTSLDEARLIAVRENQTIFAHGPEVNRIHVMRTDGLAYELTEEQTTKVRAMREASKR